MGFPGQMLLAVVEPRYRTVFGGKEIPQPSLMPGVFAGLVRGRAVVRSSTRTWNFALGIRGSVLMNCQQRFDGFYFRSAPQLLVRFSRGHVPSPLVLLAR